MILTADEIARATGCPASAVRANWPLLGAALADRGITGRAIEVMTAATIALETAYRFAPIREFGSDKYLAKYDTGALAKRLGNTPEADGDGIRYCGRGFFQHTGRDQYAQLSRALGVDLLAQPDLLLGPGLAAQAAAWYIDQHNLVTPAEAGDRELFRRRVNGGLNGFADFCRCVDRLTPASH